MDSNRVIIVAEIARMRPSKSVAALPRSEVNWPASRMQIAWGTTNCVASTILSRQPNQSRDLTLGIPRTAKNSSLFPQRDSGSSRAGCCPGPARLRLRRSCHRHQESLTATYLRARLHFTARRCRCHHLQPVASCGILLAPKQECEETVHDQR